MSTNYRTVPQITVADLVKTPGLSIVDAMDNALMLSAVTDKNIVWAHVLDGIVVSYTRCGGNNAAPVFNAICEERIIHVISEDDDEFFIETDELDDDPGDDDLI